MTGVFRNLSIALAVAMLGGCGGGGGSSDTSAGSTVTNVVAVASGVLIDSPVAGLTYVTATQRGKTGARGEFAYVPGEMVTFSIGNVQLPAVAGNATITPLDMAQTADINHQIVSNILVLLQSLDDDGDPGNGITIPVNAAGLASTAINFDVSPVEFSTNGAVVSLVTGAAGGKKALVTEAAARAHFQETLSGKGASGKINVAPVADAGVSQSVLAGTTVTLDGSKSSDANSDALTYAWTLQSRPSGSTAAVSSATAVNPLLALDLAGTYIAALVVNDGVLNSLPKKVTITASATNAAPVANAGQAQNVSVGTKVSLTGAASSDANGDALTYAWTLVSKPAGSNTTLVNANAVNPTLTPDVPGNYQAGLVVNDGKLSSEISRVLVTANSVNSAPTANAGLAQSVLIGSNVSLDGSASTDANGDTISYAWTLTSKPTGSSAALTGAATVKTSFKADVAGTYVASLVASDGKLNSAPATVTVTAAAAPSSAAFNMAQTISDGAQGTTMAFSGLALMTGNLAAQSFFPPGKVADYTGFQYLRDNDPDNMGHNTSFLTRVANNVLYVLTDSQLAQLSALAATQQTQIDLYGYKRFPLMQAFRRLIDGNLPTGSTGLNLNAVKQASRALYLIDGQISVDRAVLYASVINSLSATQKAYLASMKGKGWNSWPDITDAQLSTKLAGLAQGSKVAVMTYASDIYSWYAGSLEADIYFCPERHGTYYGGFYIKDAPAVGHEGYSIDEQMTATAGAALIDASRGYVTQSQATAMGSLVTTQKDNLNAIVSVRTQIATLLRSLLTSPGSASTVKAQVLALSATYGELDGASNYAYASTFAQVYKTLTDAQKTKLATLRKSMMSGKYADGTAFDFSVASTPFLYSSVLSAAQVAPYIADSATSPLFFEP